MENTAPIPQTQIVPRRIGRPTKMTETTIRKLELALRQGVSDQTACRYAKITPDTFYNHLKSDPVFLDRIDTAKNYLKLLASKRLVSILKKGSDRDAVPLVKFTLEKLEPEQFGQKDAAVVINNNIEYVKPSWYKHGKEETNSG